MNLQAIQDALDSLGGTNADFGFFHVDGNRKVYSCSSRLLDGNLAYGTGPTVEAAYNAAMRKPPIVHERKASA